MNSPIKVLVVDDSPVVRQSLRDVLSGDPDLKVIGTAADPFEAVALMREIVPDVITLDIEMPRMDGLTFLERLMAQHPIPVVVCSSHATSGAEASLRAFALGAVEVITKPRVSSAAQFAEAHIAICDAVKAAATVPRHRLGAPADPRHDPIPTSAAAPVPVPSRYQEQRVIVIGASTGGTQALTALLEVMPPQAPGLVIVQHMPERFTAAFAQNLNTFCRIQVKEADDGDRVMPGRALIAPGGRHTTLRRDGHGYRVEVRDGPLVSRHRPSVDVLFRSAVRAAGAHAVAALLTGMGDDGAQGMAELHAAGAITFAQDEASCVVFGMPREAIRRQAVDHVVSLTALPAALLRACEPPAPTLRS